MQALPIEGVGTKLTHPHWEKRVRLHRWLRHLLHQERLAEAGRSWGVEIVESVAGRIALKLG